MHNKKLRDLKNLLRFVIVDSCKICYNDACFITKTLTKGLEAMANYRNDLEQFIYEYCYNEILQTASAYLAVHPTVLDLSFCRIKYPDSASILSLLPQFTTNIAIAEDKLSFDAIMSGIIELSEETYTGTKTAELNQWLRISCVAVVTDKLDSFTVEKIVTYKKGADENKEGVAASSNMVPIVHKDELDQEAEAFLTAAHFTKALEEPCAVPILDLAKNEFGLNVIQGKCITQDFSVFGQICFAGGEIELYDPFETGKQKAEVPRGTIVIDAMTFFDRNIGCVNNTLAHEVYHWYRHRLYAAIKMLLQGKSVIAHRCPAITQYPKDDEVWTDEQRMEWQANKIAPRILMPISTFMVKVQTLLAEHGYEYATDKDSVMECVIDELSEFYHVSKQSAKIRLLDAGFEDAARVYNYDHNPEPVFSSIEPRDAFYEYYDNPEFRKLIDSGLFVYVNGFFVVNDPKYVTLQRDGSLSLTDYAWHNIGECTLRFAYRKINVRIHGQEHADTFHRDNKNTYDKLPYYDASRNASVVAHASDLQAKRAEFEAQLEESKLLAKSFWQVAYELMEKKKWNASIFCDKTGLNQMVYSRAKNNEDSLPDVRTVISICAGLDLDIIVTNQLLALAGHTLTNSHEHRAYSFAITGYHGRSLQDRNEFLRSVNVDELGSKQRK